MKKFICIAGKNEIAVKAMQHLLDAIDKNDYKLVACVNKSDSGQNTWQPSYAYFCKKNAIEIVSLSECYQIEDLLFVSLEYDKLIAPEKFLSKRLFNVHFSKLPAFKGMFTSIFPILHGETQAGVTLHRIDKGIDTGEIIDSITFDLPIEFSSFDLYKQFLKQSYNLFLNNIQVLINKEEKSFAQPVLSSSYYSKSSIDFSKIEVQLNRTAFQIHNQIRAFAFREYQLPVVSDELIYKSEIIQLPPTGKAGTIVFRDEWFIIVNSIDYQVKLYVDKLAELLEAAEAGDLTTYQYIQQNKYPVRLRNKRGWDALIVACFNNQILFAKQLLDDGWDVNSSNWRGTTAAMYAMTAASTKDDLAILELLMKYSPNLTSCDVEGKNIFAYAAEYGNPSVISFLQDICNTQPDWY